MSLGNVWTPQIVGLLLLPLQLLSFAGKKEQNAVNFNAAMVTAVSGWRFVATCSSSDSGNSKARTRVSPICFAPAIFYKAVTSSPTGLGLAFHCRKATGTFIVTLLGRGKTPQRKEEYVSARKVMRGSQATEAYTSIPYILLYVSCMWSQLRKGRVVSLLRSLPGDSCSVVVWSYAVMVVHCNAVAEGGG